MVRAIAVFGLAGVLLALGTARLPLAAQNNPRPEADVYHWVLPVDHDGIEVTVLHPNDCYVVQQAKGVAYFGAPSSELVELQRKLLIPTAHVVASSDKHFECQLASCLNVEVLAKTIEGQFDGFTTKRQLRAVDHSPSPIDDWYGGAYTDVGSEERERFRNAPEQRMLVQHLRTTRRSNCYEAKAPRALSIHVRDQNNRRNRIGVYRGFLYVEHHHPSIVGETVAE